MMCTHMAAFIGTPFRVQKLKDPLQNVGYVLVLAGWRNLEVLWRQRFKSDACLGSLMDYCASHRLVHPLWIGEKASKAK